MPHRYFFFGLLTVIALLTDLALSTGSSPKVLIIVCAIVLLYESVSPYVYTPS